MGNLLLIESKSINYNKVKYSVEELDFNVIEAKLGSVSYAKADGQKFDAVGIIIDENEKDVLAFVRHLKQQTSNHKTPVLIFNDHFEDSVQLLGAFKNIHYLDIGSQIETLSLKISTALSGSAKPNSKVTLDATIVNIFTKATKETLEMMARVSNIEAQKPDVFKGELPFEVKITGLAHIEKSPQFKGFLAVSFPKTTFLRIISLMLGEMYTEVTEETQDAAVELSNIIYGQAKKQLSQLNFEFPQLIPIMAVGQDELLDALNSGPSIMVPFKSSEGDFLVSVSLHK